jgi:hypothetical protein
MGEYSSFLFARPSFLEGMSRLLDVGNTLDEYNRSPTPEQADATALACDWRRVGLDIHEAIRAVDQRGAKGL